MAADFGDLIRSADNKTIKLVRSLGTRSRRESERAFVVEGVRAVEEALSYGAAPRAILIRSDADWLPEDLTLPVRLVIPPIFNAVADTENPQGVLGVFTIPKIAVDSARTPLVLVLDRVADPGNAGTAIRSAAGAGATAVLLTPGCVDAYNPKVVRAAMGAHFRVPILRSDTVESESMLAACELVAVAEANAGTRYDRAPLTGAVALVVGSEAHGVGEEWIARARMRLTIPLVRGIESLNAGVAASILLFEAARQRGER